MDNTTIIANNKTFNPLILGQIRQNQNLFQSKHVQVSEIELFYLISELYVYVFHVQFSTILAFFIYAGK